MQPTSHMVVQLTTEHMTGPCTADHVVKPACETRCKGHMTEATGVREQGYTHHRQPCGEMTAN